MNPGEEPTPLSDQDKIRLKRIAKLSQQSSTPTPSSSPPTTTKSVPSPSPALAKHIPIPAVTASSEASTSTPRKSITIHPQGTSSRYPESFQVWENATIRNILNVTLDRDEEEGSSWSIIYLKETSQELLSDDPTQSVPIKLNSGLSDQLILARLSLSTEAMSDDLDVIATTSRMRKNETAFDYLAGCWKREREERSRLLSRKGADQVELVKRESVVDALRDLIISYTGLVLMDPTMFPQQVVGKSVGAIELLPYLFPADIESSPKSAFRSQDLAALLSDLARRFSPSIDNDQESGFENVIGPLINSICKSLVVSKCDIGGGGQSTSGQGWRESLEVLLNLMSVKSIAAMVPKVMNWNATINPYATAPGLEVYSLLGPVLRLSTFPDAFPLIAQSYFPTPSAMTRGDIESATSSLRGTLRGVQTSLYQILYRIVTSGASARESFLALLNSVAKLNAKRSAMRVDPRMVSTHGFIINLHTVLLSFATPFLDSQYSKINKIDPLYYKHSSRIDVAEATKMNATQQESDAYYTPDPDVPLAEAPNFISEIFFLCSAYLHIGPMHSIREHKGITQQLGHMKRSLEDIEADTTWRGTPSESHMLMQIENYKKKQESYKSEKYAYEVQLLDPEYLTRCVGFNNLVMAWLVRMVDPKQQHPAVQIQFPLPEATPQIFRMLPEYLIEDITEFLTFVSKYSPGVLADNSQDELMTFMLVFLSTAYMKNPYLKGQFVEIMYYLSQPTQRSPRGSLGDVINFHPLALKHFIPSLINVYVEIENTGSHTQFYDKFNTRYYITQLLKLVWSNPTHREALKAESLNIDSYVRFVNLLMNDTTFLLEESLIHLGKILDIQKQMDDTTAWDAKPVTERQEIEKLLRQYEGTVRSDLDLGTESLRLLKLFTAETKGPFLTPEIVDRLAAMLDYNLNMLAGPRCQDLKVREPEKYKFRPKELLGDVLQIYLELGDTPEFQEAVAKDGRSYSKELFERAERFAAKMGLKTEDELEILRRMVAKVEIIKALEEADDAMGEVPDEFLDPLTYDIMRDPVLLPSSKTIVDRSTIKQHYLSDATDPFNRVALVWEDITDATELKAQIDAFLSARRANRGKPEAVMDDDTKMDL